MRLVIHLVFPAENNNTFHLDIQLKGVVEVDGAVASMLGTKLELKMQKAESCSWAKLDIPKVVSKEKKDKRRKKYCHFPLRCPLGVARRHGGGTPRRPGRTSEDSHWLEVSRMAGVEPPPLAGLLTSTGGPRHWQPPHCSLLDNTRQRQLKEGGRLPASILRRVWVVTPNHTTLWTVYSPHTHPSHTDKGRSPLTTQEEVTCR